MQWFNDIVDWAGSEQGMAVITAGLVPFVAILVAGLIAGLIGRGAVKRLVRQRDADYKAGVVASLVSSARRASQWSTLSGEERQYAETLAGEADIRLRLLPVDGAAVAADWAAHEIAELRKHSVHYSRSTDQAVIDFRDRLVEWEFRPRRARKQFTLDLERWRFAENDTDKELEDRQQAWIHERTSAERAAAGSTSAPAAPASPAATIVPLAPKAVAPVAATPAAAPTSDATEPPVRHFTWTPPASPAAASAPSSPAEPAERKPVGANGLDEDGLAETQALEPVAVADKN
jgi:F0F1-type ATP synthase membrane subunit c/vacuolar-type H+-ATPase subunit K